MEERRPPKGLIADLITPLSDGGRIDKEGLNNLAAGILPHVEGILLGSPRMGEGMTLGLDRRVELFKEGVNLIDEAKPILFWISGESSQGTKKILSALEDCLSAYQNKGRKNIFWLDSPLYYHSNRGLYDHYNKLASLSTNPFVLYNDPGLIRLVDKPFKRTNIRTNILKKLGQMQTIKGMVFCGSLARVHNYQKSLVRRSDFKVYDGDESRFLEHPSMSGIVSMGANLVPGTWATITKASLGIRQSEDPSRLFELGALLKDLLRIYGDNPVWTIKRALYELNMIASSASTLKSKSSHDNSTPLIEFLSHHHLS